MKRGKKQELLIFLSIVAIAAFFRLYKLDQFPPGLYPDEAMNGSNALEALETGDFKVFYPENNGREGLFINIQALSVKAFGNEAWALRLVSALFGIITVAGLYLLAKTIFDWRIASLASFFMAVSFWHVNFSRIGFRAIMLPFVLVFGFYFLWKGLKKLNKLDFTLAGIFAGIGFHTYISYRIAPLIAILLFLNYWWYLKKDFSHDDYEHARNKLLQGFALTFLVMVIVALPLGLYFLTHPGALVGRSADMSVFTSSNPLADMGSSIIKTLGMFNFSGDWNWRHNIAGSPMLHWIVGVFFVIGFLKEFSHWLKRKHGHFSPVHTLLISWFFIMLIPGFLSFEAPHALRIIGVIPVVMIFAAKGFWWFFDKLSDWYRIRLPQIGDPQIPHEKRAAVVSAVIILLGTVGFIEYWRYFHIWGPNQNTAGAFNSNYTEIAKAINASPQNINKYVVVNAEGVTVNNIPVPSQTIMFLTDSYTSAKQKEKKIYYLTEEQFKKGAYNKKGLIFKLEK